MSEIINFNGKYLCFSNFSDHEVMFENMIFPRAENAFQAAKEVDRERRKPYQRCGPGSAKQMGRNVHLQNDWEDVKNDVMEAIIYDKFTRHKDIQEILMSTANKKIVEENSWHDQYWGSCSCGREHCLADGRNQLGVILMRVRDNLIEKQNKTPDVEGRCKT